MDKNMTIVMVNYNSDYYNTDYKAKYNVHENDLRVQIWYDKKDLMDLIDIATNQIVRCNTIIIEK